MNDHTIIICSVSGGKDSTATAILALESAKECRFVFADTGHEHELTLDYLENYLPRQLGIKIETVKADFSVEIARKRKYVVEKWPEKLTKRADNFTPMSEAEAASVVERALGVLHPTGVPYLDLCLWKGRFPSRKALFCTQELKRRPLDAYTFGLMGQCRPVESWQGVRRDESLARRNALPREATPEGWTIVRPIVEWTAEQVVDYCRISGIRLNPLYSQGCSRVGCMLCINAGKAEIANAARRWPHHIDRIREWERLVGDASKRGYSTLLHHADGEGGDAAFAYRACNIDSMIDWSMTSRGGRQYDLMLAAPPAECSSVYGLCE